MPKTTSQPISSSERTSDCAPVIGTASNRFPATVSARGVTAAWAGAGRPGGGAGFGPDRGVAVVILGFASLLAHGSEHEKSPDRRRAERGWRVDDRGLAQALTRLISTRTKACDMAGTLAARRAGRQILGT